MTPKLSVITVNMNNVYGLQKTIESIIYQTFNSYEYIIIDGGSTDGSYEIIKLNEDKIAYWISEPDHGIYNAMNKGIIKAKGEYCYFLNSGDYFINDKTLEILFKLNPQKDILYGNVLIEQGNKNLIIRGSGTSNITFTDIMGTWCHQGMFLKRKLFEEHGLYDETFKISSDWVFLFKALTLYGCSFQYYNITICKYDNSGISSTTDTWREERKIIIDRYIPKRILDEYNTGYIRVVFRLKKYKLSCFLLRALNKLAEFYEAILSTFKIKI